MRPRRGAPASPVLCAPARTDPASSTSIGSAAVCAATAATFVGLGGAFLVGVLLIVHAALLVWHDAAALLGYVEGPEARAHLVACALRAGRFEARRDVHLRWLDEAARVR